MAIDLSGLGGLMGFGSPDGGQADPAMQKQMMQQMLLRSGLGMMAAGGQGMRPGAALGQAGLGAMDDMAKMQQVAYMNKMRKQVEEKRDKQWQQGFELQKNNAEESRAWRQQQADEDRKRWDVSQQNVAADNARADKSLGYQMSGAGQSSYYTPIQTSSGYVRFNNRTGQYEPMVGLGSPPPMSGDPAPQGLGQPPMQSPQPLLPINADPNLAGAKAGAQQSAKAQADARSNLPSDIANAEQSLQLIDKAISHPGLAPAVGMSSWNPINKIPGTDAANFKALQDQLQGKAFLQAYQSLKGGGQITEVEGAKAENAIARLQSSQSEDEYRKSLVELRDVIKSGIGRSKAKAGISPQPAGGQPQGQPVRLRYNPQTGQLE